MKKLLSMVVVASLGLNLQAQNDILDIVGHADCKDMLTIETRRTVGPTTAPQNYGEVLEFSGNERESVHFIEEEHHTVWYTFEAKTSADFKFELEPLDPNNDYDFALYQYTDEGFCEAVKNKEILPVRSNFARNNAKIDSRTGLRSSAQEELVAAGINPAYSKPLPVKAGQKYVLLVDNVYKEGKGHILHFDYVKPLLLGGLVQDIDSKEPLAADVFLVNVVTKDTLFQTNSDEDGIFANNFEIPLVQSKAPLLLHVKHPDYPLYRQRLDAIQILSLRKQPLVCELGQEAVTVVGDKRIVPDNRSFELEGKVVDDETNTPIQATVMITNTKTGEVIAETESDAETGEYKINVDVAEDAIKDPLHLEVYKDGYFFQDTIFKAYTIPQEAKKIRIDRRIPKLKKNAKFIAANILFHGGSPKPVNSSVSSIKVLFKLMKRNKKLRIKIDGHTNGCPDGKASSIRLSDARTMTVKDFLIKNGIDPDRIENEGFGCKYILYPVGGYRQHLNRRVEIKILDI
ncbi:MAG: OmpA family protein [Aureispira sp.]|nr:OmpA family protein [Aureispira sp.]